MKKKFIKKGKKIVLPTTPDARSGHLLLTSDTDVLYMVGGYTELGPKSDVWSYRPSKNIWQLLIDEESSQLAPRFEFDGCIIGSNIYIFGGFQSDEFSSSILNELWVFRIERQSWKMIAEETPCPERSGHIVTAIDDHNFVVHGGTCMGARDDLWVYNVKSNTWIEIHTNSKRPCARSMHSAVYDENTNSLVIFGGVTQQENQLDSTTTLTTGNSTEIPSITPSPVYLNDMWILHLNADISKWQWTLVEYQGIAPSPRDLPALVVVGNGILLFGGFGLLELADEEGSDDGGVDDDENDDEHEDMNQNEGDVDKDREEGNEEEGNGEEESEGCMDLEEHADSEINDKNINALDIDQIKMNIKDNTREKKEEKMEKNRRLVFDDSNVKEIEEDKQSDDINNEENDNENEDDDDESIDINYLSDAWYLNFNTFRISEFDISNIIKKTELSKMEKIIQKEFKSSTTITHINKNTTTAAIIATTINSANNTNNEINKNNNENITLFSPRRGCKFACLNNDIISFGGFDGIQFYSTTETFDVNLLKEIIDKNLYLNSLSLNNIENIGNTDDNGIFKIDDSKNDNKNENNRSEVL